MYVFEVSKLVNVFAPNSIYYLVVCSDVNRFIFCLRYFFKNLFFLENEYESDLVEFLCSDGSNRERKERPFCPPKSIMDCMLVVTDYQESVASFNFTM